MVSSPWSREQRYPERAFAWNLMGAVAGCYAAAFGLLTLAVLRPRVEAVDCVGAPA